MKTASKAIGGFIRRHIGNHLLAGVLVLSPVAATFLVLRLLFNWLDGLLQPVLRYFWGQPFPGAGLAALILLLYVVGVLTSTYFGRWFLSWAQKLVLRIPVVHAIYSAFKGVADSFAKSKRTPFEQPVLVQYPRVGMWTIGFLTSGPITIKDKEWFTVYLPSTPTPTTGYVLFVPKEDITPAELTVEEAMRIIVSGGILTPEKI